MPYNFFFLILDFNFQGRFSIVGSQPTMEIVAKENLVTIMDHDQGTRIEEFVEDPMTVPSSIMSDWKPMLTDELPSVFCGMLHLG